MIPPFNENGWLPDGIHDCTLQEAAERFGAFQSSERRPELWARFSEFMREAKECQLMEAVLLDGSFVTAEAGNEKRYREDKIMIETAEQLYQAIEQMGRMQRILESYRNKILTKNPRNFGSGVRLSFLDNLVKKH